jgi:hypothetical protein
MALRWLARPDGSTAVADCRLADRAGVLFSQPMRVEWTTADVAANEAQPVNPAVLVAAAELIAARATAAALAANRAGRFDEATSILRNAAASLRAMATGIPEIAAIADKLDAERPTYTVEMNQMALKTRHFAAYSRMMARDEKGRARRVVP